MVSVRISPLRHNEPVLIRPPSAAITRPTAVKMNYKQYEAQIVQKHLVALKGWPLEKFASPSDIGSVPKLSQLRDALVAGSCCWEKISEDDAKARRDNLEGAGEIAHTVRKTRSDNGKKRKRSVDDEAGTSKAKDKSGASSGAVSTVASDSDGEGSEQEGRRGGDRPVE